MYKRSMYVRTKYKRYTLLRENLRSPTTLEILLSVFTHTGTGLRSQSPRTLESDL